MSIAGGMRARVRFINVGRDQVPGLIVMRVSDEAEGLRPIDPALRSLVVLLDATRETQRFANPNWEERSFELHPVQQLSYDEVVKGSRFDSAVGAFEVPGRTAAVFVEEE